MKKLYTILAAAAVTLSAGAVKPITEVLPASSANKTLKEAASFVKTDVQNSLRAGQKFKVQSNRAAASRAAATVEDITACPYAGEYYSLSQRYYGWNGPSIMIVQAVEGNQVVVSGLWDSNMKLNGTYDPEQGTISIPAKQTFSVNTSSGLATVTVALLDVTVEAPYPQLDKDIVLTVDAENRNIYYEGEVSDDGYLTEVIGMCAEGGAGYYDFIAAIEANMYNSYMVWYYPSYGEDEEAEPEYVQTECPIWAEVSESEISITNFLNSSFYAAPVEFALDNDAKTATATNAYIGSAYADETGTTKLDFYLWGFEESGEDLYPTPTVVFDGEATTYEDGTPCTVFSTDFCGIFDKNYEPLSEENYMAIYTQFVIDGDVFSGAGISNVTVADENAPVEYFNLQGVRVDNPSNGLYIRRQGNTATKVLVK